MELLRGLGKMFLKPFLCTVLLIPLNLWLQDAARQIPLLRDALDTVRDIVKLINYSPKHKTLFSEKLHDHSVSCNSSDLKPLCPTRWTVRAEAIDAIIKQYTIITETLDEVYILPQRMSTG